MPRRILGITEQCFELSGAFTISEPRINDRIRVPEVRLIGPGGEQVGVVGTSVALKLAQDAELDLVEVAPDARPPVAKLMDYGKFKYEADIKAREARRNQANTVLKEIRFRLKIDDHDYETKKGHVERFLHGGDKVKVMIMFRGREQSRPELGVRLLNRLAADVEKLGVVESMPKQDGRNMVMVLGPTRKKAEAEHERRKHAEEVNKARITKSEARRANRDSGLLTGEIPIVVSEDASGPEFAPEVEAVAIGIAAAAVEEANAAVAVENPVAAPRPPAPAPVAPRSPAPRPAAASATPSAPRPRATPKPAGTTPKPVVAPKPAASTPKRPATPRATKPKPPIVEE